MKREPITTTLLRTTAIALVVGGYFAWRAHSLWMWPVAALLAMWFSFGGHWVEVFFLKMIRPRVPGSRAAQIAVRVAVWFAGGVLLGFCMVYSMQIFEMTRRMSGMAWWKFGVGFVAIELVVHLVLMLRRCPSFYDGRG